MSLPVGHSKSEADKVILRAVHHRAADSFIASRLAVRAVDYNERESGRERGSGRETQTLTVFGNEALFQLSLTLK